MIEIRRNPSPREQLLFVALLVPLFFFLAGGFALRKLGSLDAAVVIWSAGAGLSIVGLAVPSTRRTLYVGWMYLVYPIGWTVSHLLLLAVFYLVVTPIGYVMRALGRDPMERRLDPAASSYWIERHSRRETDSYFHQY